MWTGLMKEYLEHPSLMSKKGMFRKTFEAALAANKPEAHYLEGLRYAVWEKDICLAKKQIFKAVNLVPEATFVMAMLAICSGEKELGEFFTDVLFSYPWGDVLAMGDFVLASVERMGVKDGTAYARSWNGPVPDCSDVHNIHNRCEECYIHWCSKEFCK